LKKQQERNIEDTQIPGIDRCQTEPLATKSEVEEEKLDSEIAAELAGEEIRLKWLNKVNRKK
jgi:hypothetical protein